MIYEGVFNLLILGVLIWLFPRHQKGNSLLMFYFVCYFTFRFILEFVRLYPPLFLGLTGIQVLCVLTLLGVSIWYWRWKKHVVSEPYPESGESFS